MRIGFRFRTIPLLVTIALVALGIALGQWQQRRAAGKLALQATLVQRGAAAPVVVGAAPLAPAALEFRRVRVTGTFLADWPLFLDNRPQDGKVGFYLLMPLRIAGSNMHVLVARGWLPRYTAEHDRLPTFPTPAGEVTVTGIARGGLGHVMQLGTPPTVKPRAILQNIDLAQFAQASGLALQPFVLEQDAPAAPGDTLERAWPAPALGVERNQGYAFQWYALAAMAFLFFLITGFRRGTNKQA